MPTTRRPIAAQLSPAGLFVGESHHAADFRMNARTYPFHVIAYVLAGEGCMNDTPCAAGDVVIAPRGLRYNFADTPGSPMSLYVLCLDSKKVELPKAGVITGDDLLAQQVRDILRRLLFEQTLKRPAHDMMMLGLAQQLVALLHRADPPAGGATLRARVEAYVAQMPQTFFDDAAIDAVAARLGMSRRRFTDLFKQVAGDTWHNRRRAMQLDHARRLLKGTDRTATAIAFECGFADLSSFYRAFKRAERMSPNAWR